MPSLKELITEDVINDAQKKYNENWKFGNDVLYKMCELAPRHDQIDWVLGKIWLIGRSYAAAIERRRKHQNASDDAQIVDTTYSEYNGDKFYEDVVWPRIKEGNIDAWLQPLRDLAVDEETISISIEAHNNLMNIFNKISGNKRSLASKYLHFHAPNLFFIYDSRATTAISKLRKGGYEGLKYPSFKKEKKNFDPEYAQFCHSCLWLQSEIKKQYGIELTPRALDNILYSQS
jgi:hypothetical protein